MLLRGTWMRPPNIMVNHSLVVEIFNQNHKCNPPGVIRIHHLGTMNKKWAQKWWTNQWPTLPSIEPRHKNRPDLMRKMLDHVISPQIKIKCHQMYHQSNQNSNILYIYYINLIVSSSNWQLHSCLKKFRNLNFLSWTFLGPFNSLLWEYTAPQKQLNEPRRNLIILLFFASSQNSCSSPRPPSEGRTDALKGRVRHRELKEKRKCEREGKRFMRKTEGEKIVR